VENKEKYDDVFTRILRIDGSSLTDDLVYNSVTAWDSIGHMQLVSEIELVFDIMIDTEDVLAFSSYPKGKEILKKYGVEL